MQKIRALIYPTEKLVGCVLIQACFGGNSEVVHLFDKWLLAPKPDMKWAEMSWNEWQELAKEWNNSSNQHGVA